ncbi:MAG: phage holin family protein [Defluviitaleaceae bacterium]|nr:phage holin family protein [Defluviitaleaceae bacterium]
MRVLITWIFSAVILWLLSFVPFMNISFGGVTWRTILIVAIVVGLINAIVVPIVKDVFKKGRPAVIFCVSLIVDAAALWLAGWLIGNFYIQFFPTAIIAAAILAMVNVGAGFHEKQA